jgi:hypothetical protein
MEREDEEAVLVEMEGGDSNEEEGDAIIPTEQNQTSFRECGSTNIMMSYMGPNMKTCR